MNLKQTKLVIAPTTAGLLASVPYMIAPESRIECHYNTGLVSLIADHISVTFTAYNQTLRKSDMK